MQETIYTRVVGWCYCPRKLLLEVGLAKVAKFCTRNQSFDVTHVKVKDEFIGMDDIGECEKQLVTQARLILAEVYYTDSDVCFFLLFWRHVWRKVGLKIFMPQSI